MDFASRGSLRHTFLFALGAGAPPPEGRGPRASGQQPLKLFLRQLLGPLRATRDSPLWHMEDP